MNLANRIRNLVSGNAARLGFSTAHHRISLRLEGRRAAVLLISGIISFGAVIPAVEGMVERTLDRSRASLPSHVTPADPASGDQSFSFFRFRRFSDIFIPQRPSIFRDEWLAPTATRAGVSRRDRNVFDEEMSRINGVIRRQFFAKSIPYGGIIHEKAQKYDVDPALVAAVMEQESDFQRTALSEVGARGLMQLMPDTGRWLGVRNLDDPEENVDAGVRYIKYLQGRFHGNVKQTLAAYNAGEASVIRYGGIPPFRETQSYVKRVLHNYEKRTRELRQFTDDVRAGL